MMLEVLVALVLFAILIVPLAGSMHAAIASAKKVREQAGEEGRVSADDVALEAWMWGGEVPVGWWRPGPKLYVDSGGYGGQDVVVGLWLAGWCLGEERVGADGILCVAQDLWLGRASTELVVRLRSSDGVWGPPWRTLVPGPDGVVPVPSSEATDIAAGQEVVAHAPTAGSSKFELSWNPTREALGAVGLPFLRTFAPFGACSVALDGVAQSMWIERGRSLDVYF